MIIIHILLGILYIGLPFTFILYYRTYRLSHPSDKNFFLTGFLLKIFGATTAVLIYKLYYGGGDTTEYFASGTSLLDFLTRYPQHFFEIMTQTDLKNYSNIDFISYGIRNHFWMHKSTYTISKIAIVLNGITLNSFYLTSILCSYISFFCSWKFYRLFTTHYTANRTYLGLATFAMPSVIFWGSGLFKDTFTLGGLYLLTIGFINIFGYNKIKLSNILYILCGVYLLYHIRSFFLLAALPFLAIWVINIRYTAIPNKTLRLLMFPLFIVVAVLAIFLLQQTLTQTFAELSAESLINTSKGFQSWHTSLQGSAYSLGDIDYSTSGVVSKIPAAINVTLFRPYLWEAGKPIILLSAFQSLFFLGITIYLFLKMRIIYGIFSLMSSPQAIALMGFSLFYALIAGFTSYNFGALDRYKIPCLSTYMLALIFTWEKYKEIYSNKRK